MRLLCVIILCCQMGGGVRAVQHQDPTLYDHLLAHLRITPADIVEVKQHFTQSVDDTYELRLRDGRHFALKHFHRTPYARKRTYEMSHRAHALGLGPEVAYISPNYKVMLLEWVPGEKQRSLESDVLKGMAKDLKVFHQHSKSVAEQTQSYYPIEARCLSRFNDIEQSAPWNYDALAPVIALWKRLKAISFSHFSQDKSFIHGDLNPSNILFLKPGKPVYIDWGDAVKSDVMDDLAALSYYYHLDGASEEILLQTYYDEAGDMEQKISYLRYKKLFYLLHHSLWAFMKAQLFPQYLRPLTMKNGAPLTPWLKRTGRDPHQVKKAGDFMDMAEKGLYEFMVEGQAWLSAHRAQSQNKKRA